MFDILTENSWAWTEAWGADLMDTRKPMLQWEVLSVGPHIELGEKQSNGYPMSEWMQWDGEWFCFGAQG